MLQRDFFFGWLWGQKFANSLFSYDQKLKKLTTITDERLHLENLKLVQVKNTMYGYKDDQDDTGSLYLITGLLNKKFNTA